MENASQALIIGGTILIAILVLSLGVYLFTNSSKIGESYNAEQEIKELVKFNSRFTVFEARKDILAQEIVTLANYVRNYNKENVNQISVIVNGKNYASTTEIAEANKDETFIKFIKDNAPDQYGKMKYFECIECKIDENTGKVVKIVFK